MLEWLLLCLYRNRLLRLLLLHLKWLLLKLRSIFLGHRLLIDKILFRLWSLGLLSLESHQIILLVHVKLRIHWLLPDVILLGPTLLQLLHLLMLHSDHFLLRLLLVKLLVLLTLLALLPIYFFRLLLLIKVLLLAGLLTVKLTALLVLLGKLLLLLHWFYIPEIWRLVKLLGLWSEVLELVVGLIVIHANFIF